MLLAYSLVISWWEGLVVLVAAAYAGYQIGRIVEARKR